MNSGINLAPSSSSDTILFSDLMLQCQAPRMATNWNPGGFPPGSAVRPNEMIAGGLSWTIIRDGGLVPAPYLAGTYRNESDTVLRIGETQINPGDEYYYDGSPALSIYIQASGDSPMPRFRRVDAGILQPEVITALRRWNHLRIMEPFMVQHRQGRRRHAIRPYTIGGINYSTACAIARDVGTPIDISIDLDTVSDEDELRAVISLIAENTTGPVGLFVVNEVWNTVVFSEAVRLVELAGGDFWAAMQLYAIYVTRLHTIAHEIMGDRAVVHCESNQHIGGLTETLRSLATYDRMMLNGYLYMDSDDPDVAREQLLESLESWKSLTEPFTDEPWGLYEQGLHVVNAGTNNVLPGRADAMAELTRSPVGGEVTSAHLQVCKELGAEWVSAYCMEREPRNVDPKAVSEFGIRQGLLSGDMDTRLAAYQQDKVTPTESEKPTLVVEVEKLHHHLQGAADSVSRILQLLQ